MVNFLTCIFLVGFSVVVHELGHWAFLARFKIPVTEWCLGLGPTLWKVRKFRFALFPLGGAVVPDSAGYAQLTHAQRFLVALGGPLFSALWAVVLLLCADVFGETKMFKGLHMLGELNLYIALFNLAPIPPLDGFSILTEFCGFMGKPASPEFIKMHARIGNGLVYGFGFLLVGSVLIK